MRNRKGMAQQLALVTGASSGIGYELAKQFAQNGFDLIVAAEDDGIHTAARDFQQLGASVQPVQVDLTEYDNVENLYRQVKAAGRPLDAAALNAGVGVGGDFVHKTDLEAELKLIDLNVKSTVHLAKRVLKDMTDRGQGKVLFTASVVSIAPGPLEAVYGGSKAFVYNFAQALRGELKDTGVTITALMPGATETNFFHRAGMDNSKVGQSEKDDPAEVAQEGYEALMAGKDSVIAGSFKNKVLVGTAKIAPETAAAIHRSMAEEQH